MPTVGCIGEFEINQPDSWDAYLERLKFYFEANGITDEGKKRATLLAVCGLPTLRIAKSLITPNSLSDMSYEAIIEALPNHFIPKPSEIYGRFHFQRRLQRDGEGIAAYVAALREMAENCNFGSNLDEWLRDQLVCGMKDEELQKKLLTRSALTFQTALREALAAESACGQVKDIRFAKGLGAEALSTHAVRRGAFNPRATQHTQRKKSPSEKHQSCAGCGGNHSRSACRFKNAVCRWCHREGHIEKVCRSKNATGVSHKSSSSYESRKASANALQSNEGNNFGDVYQRDSILSVQQSGRKKVTTTVIMEGRECPMEVDPGSDFTIISIETYRALWTTKGPPIEPCNLNVIDFQRQRVPLVGTCIVDVSYGSFKGPLRLYIAKRRRTSLLGNDWFNALGIRLTGVHQVNIDPVEAVVEEFSDVFEHLGFTTALRLPYI